jgi:uncharacterized protein (TIGR04255 family)
MTTPFPSFRNPPVTEVVVASRFEPSNTYSILKVAELAETARSLGQDSIEERPGYEAPMERLGLAPSGPQVSLELLSGPPPTRYWFRNSEGDELLQLQPNWLAANWRKVAPTAQYGRWDSRWAAFATWAEQVERALVGQDTGLVHDQVEVTYVNHIDGAGVWSSHADADKVFSFVTSDWCATPYLEGTPEFGSTELRYEIPHPTGDGQIGRLHVKIAAVFRRPSNEPMFLMDLTARGRPTTSGLSGVKEFAEIGHEWIVRTFAQLTTTAMHDAWDRIDQGGTTDD